MFHAPGTLAAGPLAAGIPLGDQAALGIDWHAVQVVNGPYRNPPAFGDWMPNNLKRVGWGVTYSPGDFFLDGAALAQTCSFHQLDGLIIDAEECLKGADPRPLIQALSTFKGPKALTTFGSTTDWSRWTYDIDIAPWLAAGYWLMPQAYFNEEDFFHPLDCLRYWERVGWPVDRINLMIGTHVSAPDKGKPNTRLSGSVYADILSGPSAKTRRPKKRALSIFLAETTEVADYQALAPFLSRDVPQSPPPPPPAASGRDEAIAALRPIVDGWRRAGMSERAILRQRAGFALKALEMPISTWYGPRFSTVDELIDELLA